MSFGEFKAPRGASYPRLEKAARRFLGSRAQMAEHFCVIMQKPLLSFSSTWRAKMNEGEGKLGCFDTKASPVVTLSDLW